ncbi:MAG TPA: STM4012 family radical SAM protein [Herpetosiphonaceae bacterium]
MTELAHLLRATPYLAYAYSYPHKQAYRPLEPPVPLRDVWQAEPRDALFLYLHVPFCEMRCGFCNLFTTVDPGRSLSSQYLDALERQARQVRAALGPAAFARLAIGGGTPTFLDPAELHRLFDIAEQIYAVDPTRIPVSVETSPATATLDRLRVLRQRGVDRISIGVQSFADAEVKAIGRPQQATVVAQALDQIRAVGFGTLNIDLIYGGPEQTVASWIATLEAALRFAPEELYLYPLYIRPLTGLGRRSAAEPDDDWDEQRLACYRAGRALLQDAGYRQISMRMFRAPHAPAEDGPVYCCQNDGMVGLGCGARSYTRALHYSSEYAVGASGVRAILHDYIARPAAAFDVADYGTWLDLEDQRRRYLIQSLLQVTGLSPADYRARFGTEALADFPELSELPEHGLATVSETVIRLTAAGLERSDTIGPWLYAARVSDRIKEFELR